MHRAASVVMTFGLLTAALSIVPFASAGCGAAMELPFEATEGCWGLTIQPGVTAVRVNACGAAGGNGGSLGGGASPGAGALGGGVEDVLPVTPGEIIYIFVGGRGGAALGGAAGSGGANGGVPGGTGTIDFYGGGGGSGGQSDVRQGGFDPPDRVIVAGGGGGGGGAAGEVDAGGDGGSAGQPGQPGVFSAAGGAGTNAAGGLGGATGGLDGTVFDGGDGGTAADAAGGGGGGGGFHGGGGGGADDSGAGGGGGASLGSAQATFTSGVDCLNDGNGRVLVEHHFPDQNRCTSSSPPGDRAFTWVVQESAGSSADQAFTTCQPLSYVAVQGQQYASPWTFTQQFRSEGVADLPDLPAGVTFHTWAVELRSSGGFDHMYVELKPFGPWIGTATLTDLGLAHLVDDEWHFHEVIYQGTSGNGRHILGFDDIKELGVFALVSQDGGFAPTPTPRPIPDITPTATPTPTADPDDEDSPGLGVLATLALLAAAFAIRRRG